MSEKQQPAVLITAAEMAQKQLAEDYAKLRAEGFGETVEGGDYINAAGERVNANGEPIGRKKAAADDDDAAPAKPAAKSASKR